MIPPYPGSNARARDRVQALQAYYQQQQPSNSPATRAPVVSGTRRSSSHRGGVTQLGPVASSSDQTGGFYFFPSSTSSRNFQEAENMSSRFHAWERDHMPSFSLNQVDRDPGWSVFHQVASGSDQGSIRPSSLRRRHGAERTLSQQNQA